jgi:hypothetical protein
VHGRGPSWPPVRDRSSEKFDGVPRVFLSPVWEGGSQPRYAKAPSSTAIGLRRPHFSTISPVPPQNTCGLQNSRNKKQNTRRSFLYSVQERSFLSLSPSEYRFPCIKTSITIQFQFFPVCGLVQKLALQVSASGILTAHRLGKTGQLLGSITPSMPVTRPLSFKPPPDGHTSPTVAVTYSQIAFIPSGAACRSMHCDSSG